MIIYQVLNWAESFENDRSKRRDKCSFVCIPNKQHGMGFCRVMAEPDGAAIYGIFHLIVCACSQQKTPREGWLTVSGRSPDGDLEVTPWLVDDLAVKFRRPEAEIQRALDVLCSKSVGWMRAYEWSPPTHRAVTVQSPPSTADSPPSHLERREGKEEKEEKEGGGVGVLKNLLCQKFRRPENEVWAYDEEHLISEISSRPNYLTEIKEIFDYYAKPNSHPRQSILSLLQNWLGELDKARSYDPNRNGHPAAQFHARKALEDEIKSHPANPESLSYRIGVATTEQRADLAMKRKRLKELTAGLAHG